jgi:hypothetical protein
MKTQQLITATAIFILALLFQTPSSARAQTVLSSSGPEPGLTIELLKPSYKQLTRYSLEIDDVVETHPYSTTSLVGFISANFALSGRLRGIVQVPLTHVSENSAFGNDLSANAIGNVYFGVSTETPGSSGGLEFGIRTPTTSGDAWYYGATASMRRLGSFLDHSMTASIAAKQNIPVGPLDLRLDLNPVALIPTKNDRRDVEVLTNYSALAWLKADKAEFGAGILGRAILTESELSLADRTEHEIGFSTRFDLGVVKVGVNAGIPLDKDIRRNKNGTVGINVTVPFGN